MTHEGRLPSRVVFSDTGLAETADEVRRLGLSRVYVVAGHAKALLKPTLADLAEVVVKVCDVLAQHVPETLAREAVRQAQECSADGILSVGGGSSIGLGKVLALELDIPLLVVPTTLAGSEMTPIYGITSDGDKRTGRDWKALPTTVVYDPHLPLTLSRELTAASGMNAVAHCVQALWGSDPFGWAYAEQGMVTLLRALPVALANGTDVGSRRELQRGACMGGAALAVAGTGLHHQLCHALGGRLGLPHSAVHSAVLPQVVGYNAGAGSRVQQLLARTLGGTTGGAGPADSLFAFAAGLGAPVCLREVGMRREDVAGIVQSVVAQQPDNPTPVTVEGVTALLANAWAGEKPSRRRANSFALQDLETP